MTPTYGGGLEKKFEFNSEYRNDTQYTQYIIICIRVCR